MYSKKCILITVLIYAMCGGGSGWQLTKPCRKDYRRYQLSSDLWKLEMEDATGHIESGRYSGNYVYEGDWKQCAKVMENASDPTAIRGLFCMSTWPGFGGRTFLKGQGFCIPHSCSDEDAELILSQFSYNHKLQPGNDTYTFCVRDKNPWDDPAAVFTIVFMLVFGMLVLVSTIYEGIYQRKKEKSRAEVTSDIPLTSHNSPNTDVANVVDTAEAKPENTEPKTNSHEKEIREHKSYTPTSDTANTIMELPPVITEGDDKLNSIPQPTDYKDINAEAKPAHGISSENLKPEENAEPKTNGQENKIREHCIPIRLLLSFSLYTNIPQLLDTSHPPGSYKCLHGLRFLTLAWIIYGHTNQFGLTSGMNTATVANTWPMIDAGERWRHAAVNHSWLSVETFFVINGMLVTLSFMKTIKIQGDKVTGRQMALYYFHRYWRLTPVYMIVLMFYTNMFHYLGQGPLKKPEFYDCDNCKDVWWQHALYIQNLFGTPKYYEKACMWYTWYLAVDFQLFLVVPIYAGIAYFWPTTGIKAIVAGYAGSLACNLILYTLLVGLVITDRFVLIYIKPWTRATSYFMGIFLGAVIYRTQAKVKMHWVVVVLGWVVALALFFTSIYASQSRFCTDCYFTVAGEVIFNSLQTSMFAACVCWIIFACLTGYGGIFNTVFSWTGWIPLARLTYTGYLIHPILMYGFAFNSPQQIYVYDWLMVYLFCGHLLLTLGLAFITTLTFEMPLLGLEKIIMHHKK